MKSEEDPQQYCETVPIIKNEVDFMQYPHPEPKHSCDSVPLIKTESCPPTEPNYPHPTDPLNGDGDPHEDPLYSCAIVPLIKAEVEDHMDAIKETESLQSPRVDPLNSLATVPLIKTEVDDHIDAIEEPESLQPSHVDPVNSHATISLLKTEEDMKKASESGAQQSLEKLEEASHQREQR
jgi:hypothetical protein